VAARNQSIRMDLGYFHILNLFGVLGTVATQPCSKFLVITTTTTATNTNNGISSSDITSASVSS